MNTLLKRTQLQQHSALCLGLMWLFTFFAEATDSNKGQFSPQTYRAPGVSHPLPEFKVDASWPSLPETWIIGQVPGLTVDKHDNVWVLHRPNSLSALDLGSAQTPPTGLCCEAAPHVLQFSPAGKLLRAWGGNALAPEENGVNQWPDNVHGLFVDDRDTVWLGGNGKGDHVVLNFSADGEFIRAIGKRLETSGNQDPTRLGNPADIVALPDSNRILIADGYINKRVVSYQYSNSAPQQLWGAWGKAPLGGTREGDFSVSQASADNAGRATNAEHFGDIVHCVEHASNGLIYVCDRRNNRLQVFKDDGKGNIAFVRNLAIAGDTGGLGTATDVAFSPDNRYLYVADMMNGRIWILWHADYTVLGSIGRPGRYAGEFTWLHSVATDSQGNLYTSEVSTGRRVQKFVFSGYSSMAEK